MSTIPAHSVGLCSGRHSIPVEEYIFNGEVQNPLDFAELNRIAEGFVKSHCNIRETYGVNPAQIDYTDVRRLEGDELNVVVTGLTPCTTAVMWACSCYGVPLTLWHYNRETGDYVPQRFQF